MTHFLTFLVLVICHCQATNSVTAIDYAWNFRGDWSELGVRGGPQEVPGCWASWNMTGTGTEGVISYASSSTGKPPFSLYYAIELTGTYTQLEKNVFAVTMTGQKYAAAWAWYQVNLNATLYLDTSSSSLPASSSSPSFRFVGSGTAAIGLPYPTEVLLLNVNTVGNTNTEVWTTTLQGTSAVFEYYSGAQQD